MFEPQRGRARKVRSAGKVLAAAHISDCATPVTQRVAVDGSARASEERAQQRIAIKTAFDLEVRLWSVDYGVLKRAADACGDATRPSLGFRTIRAADVPLASRAVATEALRLDRQRRVAAV